MFSVTTPSILGQRGRSGFVGFIRSSTPAHYRSRDPVSRRRGKERTERAHAKRMVCRHDSAEHRALLERVDLDGAGEISRSDAIRIAGATGARRPRGGTTADCVDVRDLIGWLLVAPRESWGQRRGKRHADIAGSGDVTLVPVAPPQPPERSWLDCPDWASRRPAKSSQYWSLSKILAVKPSIREGVG
jgi:hypothetical protein